jgi:peroxiredoxin
MVPDVTMTAADGRVFATGDFRHRKHLVLILFPEPPGAAGIPLLSTLSSRYEEFTMENAEILVVIPAFPPDFLARGGRPFPVFEDRDGTLRDMLAGQQAPGISRTVVCVADRYGEIFRSLEVPGGDPFPLEEVLSWLRFLERLCPE